MIYRAAAALVALLAESWEASGASRGADGGLEMWPMCPSSSTIEPWIHRIVASMTPRAAKPQRAKDKAIPMLHLASPPPVASTR